MRYFSITGRIILFAALTIITQIGGIVYLISRWLHRFTDPWSDKRWLQRLARLGSFLLLYLLAVLVIVPLLARPFGRVPLPLTGSGHLRPLHAMTWLLNRHYVKPALRETALQVAADMDKAFPGTKVNYLDANFPFFTGFPLVPHLSHNDGNKLDLAFCYRDAATGLPTNESPSVIGYGLCEAPLPGEENTPDVCAAKGFWQYSILAKVVPQGKKKDYLFDEERTRALTERWTAQPAIGKLFIEPHLKQRLHLDHPKIRFHGCRAVRHDDHIHVQLK